MKRLLVLFSILALGIVFVSFTLSQTSPASVQMPDNVKAAIDKSCFGCHNSASQNVKAKEKLDFSTLSSL